MSILFGWLNVCFVQAQNVSTEGRDFWLGFMENHATSQIDLEIFISASDSTNGVLEMPLANYKVEFIAMPDATLKLTVPTHLAMAEGSGSIQWRGIHITSDKDISVYALNKRQYSSDATVVLPTVSLGQEYYAMAHTAKGNRGPSLFSELLIVGAENDTEIEIIPSQYTTDGKHAGRSYTIRLDQGETYQLQANNDLTGTRISAANAQTGACKTFAVFAGNEWTRIGNCGGLQDHIYEQMFPINTWGKHFAGIPYKTRKSDLYKVLAAFDSTVVYVDGKKIALLDAGEYHTFDLDSASYIYATEPVAVGQYSKSQDCDNALADPFFIMLSPNEQRLKKVTFNALEIHVVDNYYLNVLVPTSGRDNVFLDDVSVANNFKLLKGNPEFSYAQLYIQRGNHTLQADEGFIAYVYGYGRIESFGYATGVSLQNLKMQVISGVPGTEFNLPLDSACIDEPFEFKVTADSSYRFFDWNFGDGGQANGRVVGYDWSTAGRYPVTVIAKTSSGTCASEERATRIITITKPIVKILGPRSVCPFAGGIDYVVDGDPGNTYEWFVDGGMIVEGQHTDRIKVDWDDTNPAARVRVLPVNRLGCIGDTTAFNVKVNVQLDPSAPFGADSLCSDLAVDIPYATFFAQGNTYEWFTDFGSIVSAQGNHQAAVNWNGPGVGYLWYEESSLSDDVCSGFSDSLKVFIERAPDENIEVLYPDDHYFNYDTIPFTLNADPAFQYFSWKFGDGLELDSIEGLTSRRHRYICDGQYPIIVNAHTGTVCQNIGAGMTSLKVNPPELEMVNVTTDLADDTDIIINWKKQASPHYPSEITLWRRHVFPKETGWSKLAVVNEVLQFTDSSRTDAGSISGYYLSTNESCNTVATQAHQNLLLRTSQPDDDGFESLLQWNEYLNWMKGVQVYEIYRGVDEQEMEQIGSSHDVEASFEYDTMGLDYCYRIRAVENNGNRATSWSNISCNTFIPEILTYNVFTPNNDRFNEFLVFRNLHLFRDSQLSIYNRSGKKIFESVGYRNDWDGKLRGELIPPGVYYYQIKLNEPRYEIPSITGQFSILY